MPKFTRENAAAMGRKGGQATAQRHGREHMRQIGRLGFRATVKRHYGGDARAYINRLISLGLARIDPFPENGAWQPRPDGTPTSYLPEDWSPTNE
jgi:general stress protein YciG